MYSANLKDQLINAAFPLKPFTAWAGGASTVTVAVPQVQSLAGITVESVTVQLTLPTGAVVTQAATAVSDSPNWAATFAADNFSTSGFVAEGFVVNIVGKDEAGTSRVWIVSKGDLEIRPGDASPSPSGSYVVVKLHDAAPAAPVDGDAYISNGKICIYDGTAWQAIGGSSVEIDTTLTQQGAAADAKAAGDALAGKLDGAAAYPAWSPSTAPIADMIKSHNGKLWKCLGSTMDEPSETSEDWLLVTIDSLKQDALSAAQIGYINAVPGKADKVANATDGNLAALDAQGNLANSGAKASDFAAKADLPYRLVEPGVWEFTIDTEAPFLTVQSLMYNNVTGKWDYVVDYGGEVFPSREVAGTADDLTVSWGGTANGENYHITATRASLPGHLLDRAGNRVVVTGDTTLTLPAAVPGYLRDFLVRLEISGSTVPTITFAAPTGEMLTYETDGDDFPVPDEVGTWSYSFTENCVAHKFAVSLKKVNEVAAPQTQGGS